MTRLPEGWHDTARSIAGYCAKKRWGSTPLLTLDDRFDAGLDGIIENIHDHGWPEGDLSPIYRAAGAAIQRAARDRARNLRWWSYWLPGPGQLDAIAEHVTDRVGVRQLVWILTEDEWAAVWAYAEVMKWGGRPADAAALIGVSDTAIRQRMLTARRKCWAAWVAPGETPARQMYRRARGGRRSRYQEWTDRQTQNARKTRAA